MAKWDEVRVWAADHAVCAVRMLALELIPFGFTTVRVGVMSLPT
jgi:hypothetical protein